MRLCLINPSNPLVSIVKVKESRWNRYRVWKPLSLIVLAGLNTTGVGNLDRGREPERAGPSGHAPRPDLVAISHTGPISG